MKSKGSNPGSVLKSISDSLKKKDIEVLSLGDPDVGALVKHRIPTSSKVLNHILGGGVPCGRLTEIFGEESNGKSSLVADIMAQTQKLGGVAIIIDSEQSFDPARAAAMGVSVEDVIYSDEVTIEGAFEVMDAAIEQTKNYGDLVTIIWDSVAASPTKAELEGEIGDQAMAAKARILSKGLRRLLGKIGDTTSLIFINQVRTKMGGMSFGKNTESAGGYAIRFASSVRLELTKIGPLKVNDKPTGIRCRAYTVKNKTFPPFKTAHYEMFFTGGIDDSNALLDLMVQQEVVKQSGSWYSIGETKFMRKDFKQKLEELGEEGEAHIAKALEIL
jgi:recombination protein RecA